MSGTLIEGDSVHVQPNLSSIEDGAVGTPPHIDITPRSCKGRTVLIKPNDLLCSQQYPTVAWASEVLSSLIGNVDHNVDCKAGSRLSCPSVYSIRVCSVVFCVLGVNVVHLARRLARETVLGVLLIHPFIECPHSNDAQKGVEQQA